MLTEQVPRASSRTAPLREREWWPWLYGAALVFVFAALWFGWRYLYGYLRIRDLEGVSVKSGTATIIRKRNLTPYRHSKSGFPREWYELDLELGGRRTTLRVGEHLFLQVRERGKVQVSYRIGRNSGSLYVHRVEGKVE